MNTRLQVEHPVTEAVTSLDLVELQISVAEGRALDISLGEPRGHAIEARLYAEDPAHEWQPQSGLLTMFDVASATEFAHATAYGVRVDSGFETGSEVSTHYDAMLAKVIAWAPSRREATRMLAGALSKARLHGLVTNRDLLVNVLRSDRFLDAQVSTDFFERTSVIEASAPMTPCPQLLFAAAIALAETRRLAQRVQAGVPVGWRNVASQPHRTVLAGADGEEHVVEWLGGRHGYVATDPGTSVLSASPSEVVLEIDRISVRFAVSVTGDTVAVDGPAGSVQLRVVPRFVDPAAAAASGSLFAPMPGSVVRTVVEDGARVAAGEPVLVLEAMKMQHTITAPNDGVVSDLVAVGAQVAAGDVLAVVSTTEESP
jgi:acyl-CoA carboxylase subunit alpha